MMYQADECVEETGINNILVIKFGGSILESDDACQSFVHELAALKKKGMKFILVHGGGKHISKRLDRLNLKSEFIEGYRATNDETIHEIEMMLSYINKHLTLLFQSAGIQTIGLCGKDGGMIQAEEMLTSTGQSLGNVGRITKIDVSLLQSLLARDYLPVIMPIGYAGKRTFNINADDVAGSIAAALKAKKLLLMTDVNGVYEEYGNEESLIKRMLLKEAKMYIESNKFVGGMVPKIKSCITALEFGVKSVQIFNGNTPNCLVKSMFSEQPIGTIIRGENV